MINAGIFPLIPLQRGRELEVKVIPSYQGRQNRKFHRDGAIAQWGGRALPSILQTIV